MSPVPVAGIDVSKDFSDMCILSPDNVVFERVKIYHDKTSMERAVKKLAHAGAVFGQRPIIVMEATGHHHRILYRFLSVHRFSIVTINPLQSSEIKNVSIRLLCGCPVRNASALRHIAFFRSLFFINPSTSKVKIHAKIKSSRLNLHH